MFKPSRSLLAFLVPVAVLTMAPVAADADPALLTITVGATGTLLDPTLVRVPAELTCAPMEIGSNQGIASLRQAVFGRIAFGSGFPENSFVCDGTPQAVSYLIWVDTASAASFRRGNATVQIGVFVCPPAPTPTSDCQSGDSGIQIIRLIKEHTPHPGQQT